MKTRTLTRLSFSGRYFRWYQSLESDANWIEVWTQLQTNSDTSNRKRSTRKIRWTLGAKYLFLIPELPSPNLVYDHHFHCLSLRRDSSSYILSVLMGLWSTASLSLGLVSLLYCALDTVLSHKCTVGELWKVDEKKATFMGIPFDDRMDSIFYMWWLAFELRHGLYDAFLNLISALVWFSRWENKGTPRFGN